MSLVLMSPSTVMRLNDCSTASERACCRSFFSTAASVVRKQSMVAMFGSIMPAPLAMPPIRTFLPPRLISTAISLGKVSLVMIAFAAFRLPSRCNAFAPVAIAASIFSIGIGTPIRPVEQTSTLRSLSPSALAVSLAIRFAFWMPITPVHALALPLLAMIARISAHRICACETLTGAALTLFVVNAPAATAGSKE